MGNRVGQFDVNYWPRTVIKRQALANFIAEFTYSNITKVAGMIGSTEAVKRVEMEKGRAFGTKSKDNNDVVEQWNLYVDGASNENGSRVGMMLIRTEGHKIYCALCFGFQVSNNEAEYEALITGLRLSRELRVLNLKVYSDFQLVVNQVNDIYQARREKTVAYSERAKALLGSIATISMEVVLRSKNANTDALANRVFEEW